MCFPFYLCDAYDIQPAATIYKDKQTNINTYITKDILQKNQEEKESTLSVFFFIFTKRQPNKYAFNWRSFEAKKRHEKVSERRYYNIILFSKSIVLCYCCC